MRATGNTHSIAYEYSMANAAGFTVTTQSFAAGSYRARVAFDLAAWPSGGIGILLNTVGNDAKRCSFANAVETASPHRLTFDVYCVLPSIGGAWAYTTSDFQVVIHNSEYYNSPFAIVNSNGTLPASLSFRNGGLSTYRVSAGRYKADVTFSGESSGDLQVTAVGSSDVFCNTENLSFANEIPNTYVTCYNSAGVLTDSSFRIEFNFSTTPSEGGGYVRAAQPSGGREWFYQSSGTSASVTRWGGTGRFLVGHDYSTLWEDRTPSFVTASRRPSDDGIVPLGNYCKVGVRYPDLGAYLVFIRCFTFDGRDVDTVFNEMSTYRN